MLFSGVLYASIYSPFISIYSPFISIYVRFIIFIWSRYIDCSRNYYQASSWSNGYVTWLGPLRSVFESPTGVANARKKPKMNVFIKAKRFCDFFLHDLCMTFAWPLHDLCITFALPLHYLCITFALPCAPPSRGTETVYNTIEKSMKF